MRAAIFLLLLGLLSNIVCYDGPGFINLSRIDYSVKGQFSENSIQFKLTTNDGTTTMSCAACNEKLHIKCQKDELINVEMELKWQSQTFKVPLNVTCSPRDNSNNKFVVERIEEDAAANRITFTWKSPDNTIKEYLVYFMTSSNHKSQQISTNHISFDNLSEKTWHQICIASIDILWRTSKFTCRNVLTDFFTTGPITNITAISEIDKISLNWNNPQYKHDIPQGYIVQLNGATNTCRTIIIHMTAIHIPTNDQCPHRNFLNWTHLQDLQIDELPPFAHFNIDIIPFNKNKQFNKESISAQTKEGESDAVRNLQSSINGNYLLVVFNEPSSPQGRIIKYFVKISRVQTDICTKTNEVVHELNITQLFEWINLNVVKKCGRYLIEVSPVNGWSRNGGKGKTASLIFIKSPKTSSSLTADVQFITSNSLMVLIDKITSDDNCKILGFVIEIRSDFSNSDCVTRTISNLRCSTFIEMVDKVSQCATKERMLFDTQSGKLLSYFNRIFRKGGNYQTTIWRMTDKLEKVSRENNKARKIKDCFTDCYDSERYYGIRSAVTDGTACTEWHKSDKYRKYTPSLGNICLYNPTEEKPWCPSKSSYDYCNVPTCSDIKSGTGCVTGTSLETTTEVVSIKWSKSEYSTSVIGFITLLHNSNQLCEKYHVQMCQNCPSENNLENIVKNLYLSCSVGQVDKTTSYETQFNGLHQDKQFIVYIIPIINVSMVGEVRNLTTWTAMAKPSVPQSISLKSQTLRSIEISWDKPAQFIKHGIADHYHVTARQSLSMTMLRTQESTSESANVTDLEICTEHCFAISGSNKAGSSGLSMEKCFYTLAPKPGNVLIQQTVSGYFSSTSLLWMYSGTNDCKISFHVEYKFDSKTSTSSTDKTECFLSNLMTNAIYTVRIRAESKMDTVNDEKMGQYSPSMTFFTGVDKPNVTYYNQSIDGSNKRLQISWGIIEQMKGSMFEFIILLKNSENLCILSVHLTCKFCPDHINIKYLSEEKQKDRIKLFNCTKKEMTNFDKNNTSFNYVINSTDKLTNFSVTIYGSNLMGVHVLNKNSTAIKNSVTNMAIVSVSIFIALFLVLLIALAAFVKIKQKPSFLFSIFSRNESKKELNASKLNNNIQSKATDNILKSANNTNVVKRKSSKPIVVTDNQPMVKARNVNHAIAIINFSSFYERATKNSNSDLIQEYKKLSNEAKSIEIAIGLTVDAGKDPANSKNNRFVNILPFDQNRVKIGNKGFPLDYINASYIPFLAQDSKYEYIASQGPIEGSLLNFWKMIWKENVNCIVMLTRTMEGDKFKCLQYWPDEVDQKLSFGNKNPITVTMESEDDKEGHIERSLIVEKSNSEEVRKITQLHMHTWFDHAAPSLDYFDKLLFRFHEITNSNATHPYLIHCSAGVGRTGTLIALDRIIKDLVNGSQEINIYDTVLKLRYYRNFMVQRQAQYIFIFDYINHFLTKYMRIDGGEEILYFNEDV